MNSSLLLSFLFWMYTIGEADNSFDGEERLRYDG